MKKKNFKISLVFVYTILIVWALTTIFPLLWSIMNSFKNKKAIYNNSFALPVDKLFSLDNYKAVFANYDILNAYRNSFIISGTVAVVVILFSGMAAYILTRYKFPGKGILDALLYAGMMFPIYSTIIPVLRMMTGWGIVNTPHVSLNLLSVILPQIAGNMSFAIIVLRSYMRGLPVELEESARIDGCSRTRIFFSIIIPLLKPTMVSVVLMDMFWIWNDFMVPLIMMNNERLMTIQLSISRLFGQYASKWDIALPALVMTILPIVIVFILLQKKIMDGVIAGAVKG